MSATVTEEHKIQIEIQRLQSNPTRSRDELYKLAQTIHESTHQPIIIDLNCIANKLNVTEEQNTDSNEQLSINIYYSSLALKLVIAMDSILFDGNSLTIQQFVTKFKAFNKSQIRITSINKRSSVIVEVNMIIHINLNSKCEDYYVSNITAIKDMLSPKTLLNHQSSKQSIMDKVIIIECIELREIDNDIYNTIQILYENIFPKINNKDVLNEYEYDIIGYLIQNDINSETFHLTKKQRFVDDLLTDTKDYKDRESLTEVYNETLSYLAQIQQTQAFNKQRTQCFVNEIRAEFDLEFHHKIDELLANIITYFTDNQYDDWADIYDDVNNGYDNCNLKEVLFICLNISNIKQRQYLYGKLKKCLEIANTKPIDSMNQDFDQELKGITYNVFNTFSNKFNSKIAKEIVRLFGESVEEYEYDEIESIVDDFDEIDDSEIITYILETIDINLFNDFKSKYSNIEYVISIMLKNTVINNALNDEEKDIDQYQKGNRDSINIETRSIGIDPNIKEICKNIISFFSKKYNNKIGQEIKNSFIKQYNYMIEDAYDHASIIEEAMDIDECALYQIQSDLSPHKYNIGIIKQQLQHIILGKTPNEPKADPEPEEKSFATSYVSKRSRSRAPPPSTELYAKIAAITYDVNETHVRFSNQLVSLYASKIYLHQLVTLRQFADSKSKTGTELESAALCIVKAIDIANKLPIMRWFLKYRSILMEDRSEPKLPIKENEKESINARRKKDERWWNEGKYFKWLQHKAKFKINGMKNHIKMAVIELTKRALPTFNYSPLMHQTLIMDNINVFAKYTLASHYLIVDIKNQLEIDRLEWCPIQIDFMVIPQAVSTSLISEKYRVIKDEQKRENLTRQQHGFDPLEIQNRDSNTSNVKLDDILKNNKPREITAFGSVDKDSEMVWDIEDLMDDPRVGYHKNVNKMKNKKEQDGYYWVEWIAIHESINSIKRKMYEMLKKCQDMLKEMNGKAPRHYRYVFIIDRRDQECLKRHNMKYKDKKPNELNGYKKSIDGQDKIYLILHKEYNRLPTEWHLVQEMGLGLSKELMIRKYSTKLFRNVNLGIFDGFNGYKFAFTYHIYSKDNITPYFYYGQGGKILNLEDMDWLWPRFFMMINNDTQKLNEDIKNEIYHIQNTRNKQLHDIAFDQFMNYVPK